MVLQFSPSNSYCSAIILTISVVYTLSTLVYFRGISFCLIFVVETWGDPVSILCFMYGHLKLDLEWQDLQNRNLEISEEIMF